MPKAPKLSTAAGKIIDSRVDDIFDRLMARLLGHAFTGRHFFITHNHDLSLPGIFMQAVTSEGGSLDTHVLNGVAAIARDYLNKHKEEAKAQTKHTINAILQDVHHGRIPHDDLKNHIDTTLFKVWDKVRSGVERVVATENNNAAIMGQKEGLDTVAASFGIEDPTYVFICVHDDRLCDECRRLHLLPDGMTPRAWKASEVTSEYHVKGNDFPSWGDLHPNGRCWPSIVMPGFGFDGSGKVTWIGEGHNELEYQRSYKRPPSGEDARKKKLGKSEEIHLEPLEKADVDAAVLGNILARYGWTAAKGSTHSLQFQPPEFLQNKGFTVRPITIKQAHQSGAKQMDNQAVNMYLGEAGIRLTGNGIDSEVKPSHPYAPHYFSAGHPVRGMSAPKPPVRSWKAQGEGLVDIPLEALDVEGAPVSGQQGVYHHHLSQGADFKVPPVTAMEHPEKPGQYLVDEGADQIAAAKAHGLSHAPVRMIKREWQ